MIVGQLDLPNLYWAGHPINGSDDCDAASMNKVYRLKVCVYTLLTGVVGLNICEVWAPWLCHRQGCLREGCSASGGELPVLTSVPYASPNCPCVMERSELSVLFRLRVSTLATKRHFISFSLHRCRKWSILPSRPSRTLCLLERIKLLRMDFGKSMVPKMGATANRSPASLNDCDHHERRRVHFVRTLQCLWNKKRGGSAKARSAIERGLYSVQL